MCGYVFVFVFMVIFSRLQSFIIKNINFYLSQKLLLLPFVLFICFNVYIIVFYGFVGAPLDMRNFIAFFSLSFAPFFSVCFAFTMLRRNHMCLIFSTISLLPTCWNLGILWRRMVGFVSSTQRASERGKRGEGCETFFLLPSFFFLHHLSGFYFALALGVLINVLPLPFLAFEYYEPNITITAHYPRSYKTKAIAMTKWLLCGCGPFFGSFVLLMERAVILFIHFYYESHTNTHTHTYTLLFAIAENQASLHKSPVFMDNLFLFMCRKTISPGTTSFAVGEVGSCQC